MDDEVGKGEGNSINYKYRMHDPRVGRFFAVDPLAPKYPHNSVYAFSENRVVDGVELEGLEVYKFNDVENNANPNNTVRDGTTVSIYDVEKNNEIYEDWKNKEFDYGKIYQVPIWYSNYVKNYNKVQADNERMINQLEHTGFGGYQNSAFMLGMVKAPEAAATVFAPTIAANYLLKFRYIAPVVKGLSNPYVYNSLDFGINFAYSSTFQYIDNGEVDFFDAGIAGFVGVFDNRFGSGSIGRRFATNFTVGASSSFFDFTTTGFNVNNNFTNAFVGGFANGLLGTATSYVYKSPLSYNKVLPALGVPTFYQLGNYVYTSFIPNLILQNDNNPDN